MHNPIISIFKSLDEKEKKACKVFLTNTPAFGKMRKAQFIAIFEKLEEGCELENEILESTQKATQDYKAKTQQSNPQIFNKEYSYIKTDMLRAIEDFLSQKALKTDKSQYFLYLLKTYQEKSLERDFLDLYKKWEEWEQKESIKDSQFFLQKSVILELFANYKAKKRENQASIDCLTEAEKAFNMATYIRKMRLIVAEKVNTGKLQDANIVFVSEISNKIAAEEQPEALQIYWYCYELFETQEVRIFDILWLLVKEKLSISLKYEEQIDVFSIIIKYLAKKSNKGEKDATEQLLECHEVGFNNRWHYSGTHFDTARFLNIVRVGLKLEEIKWVEEFIEFRKGELEENQQEEIANYAKMLLFYRQKKYNNLAQLAQGFDFKDINIKLEIRRMMCKYYYDEKEFKALDSYIDAFKQFIKSHKKEIKSLNNQHFIKYLEKLLNKKTAGLQEALQKESAVAEKEWLLGRVK